MPARGSRYTMQLKEPVMSGFGSPVGTGSGGKKANGGAVTPRGMGAAIRGKTKCKMS